jgi:hypothetical protein
MWLTYDEEETDVQIDLANEVYDYLILEMAL